MLRQHQPILNSIYRLRSNLLLPQLDGANRVPLCGWLVETYDSWDRVFLLFATSYIFGALLFLAWVGDEEVE